MDDKNDRYVDVNIAIPDGVSFADLKLSRGNDGSVFFKWEPLEEICRANGISIEAFRSCHDDNVSELIARWYLEHLRKGGERDPVADEAIEEVLIEEAYGQRFSLDPGKA